MRGIGAISSRGCSWKCRLVWITISARSWKNSPRFAGKKTRPFTRASSNARKISSADFKPRMHRFYITPENWSADSPLLTGGEAHHARNVLRLGPGDKVVLFD